MASLFPGAGGIMPGGNTEGAAAAAEPPDDGKMVDLSPKIAAAECYARNEDSRFPMSNLFIGDSRLGCKSDADEQIILHVAFSEFVKVHSIKLTEFNNGNDPESNPTTVHCYANRENLGFEDIEDVEPTQTFHFSAADLKEGADPILLKFVKFQRVRSLTFFVEDNAGGEQTALGSMKIFGRPVAGTDMSQFKKQG